MMIVQTCSGDRTLTSLAFGQGGTEGFLLTSRILMLGKTLVAFEEAVAVLVISPVDDGTVLSIAQFAEIATRMVNNLVKAPFTFMAI